MSKQAEAYKNNYNRQNYDRMVILRSKGEKDKLKKVAQEQGKSMNEFLNGIINEWCEKNGVDLS